MPLPDVEPQELTVSEDEGERDCEGEAVKLCVEVTQRVTVEEMDWQPEAVNEEEKQLLDVKLSVAVAQRDCVKDIDGQPEAVYEEEKQPLNVEQGVLDTVEDGQPLWVPLPDEEPQTLLDSFDVSDVVGVQLEDVVEVPEALVEELAVDVPVIEAADVVPVGVVELVEEAVAVAV